MGNSHNSLFQSIREYVLGNTVSRECFSPLNSTNLSKIGNKINKKKRVMGDSTKAEDSFQPSFISNQNNFTDSVFETENGLCLNNVYIPEEVILNILSYVEPKDLLNHSLVCRKWNSIIKSYAMWSTIYHRKYDKKPKKLPWYLYYCLLSTNYFDVNLLHNGNGQEQFNYWQFKENGGDKCIIENPPVGADTLPLDVPEFNNCTSCFATSFGSCYKVQDIKLGNSKLFEYILNNYKPHIYLSEWTSGRFDCGCIYKLRCGLVTKDSKQGVIKSGVIHRVEQWQGSKWQKIELNITEYPDVTGITFEHGGCDTQFWAGHFGSKMAGGVVKLLFDSIEPLAVNEDGNTMPRKFSEVRFATNGEMENPNDRENTRYGMWYLDGVEEFVLYCDYGEDDEDYYSTDDEPEALQLERDLHRP